MALFNGNKRKSKLMDVIRCDEPSYLIWKWRPIGAHGGDKNRENAIRWGSSLRVKDGEVAVFVYKQKDGTMQDFIIGPFDDLIKTKNFPVLASIVDLAYNGGTPFQAEVYFINIAQVIQVKFGVPFFDVCDPRFLDFGVPVAVRGTISFNIKDYREFIKLHRLNTFNLDDFQKQIRDTTIRYVKDAVANAPAVHNIPLVQIETKTAQITDAIEYDISERLREDFGVNVSGVDIGAIEIDKSSENFHHLVAITRDIAAAKVKAETEDYVERMRIQREEGQYAMHKQTQSANIDAYQIEKQAEIGIAGAEALGHMGEKGTGSIDLGGYNGGFNPTAMMAGITLGSAVGQNIVGTMNNAMSGMNHSQGAPTPPPIPEVGYYVAINGHATGPFNVNTIAQMTSAGQFNADSLIWKSGMSEWVKAGLVDELKNVLESVPPAIPTELK